MNKPYRFLHTIAVIAAMMSLGSCVDLNQIPEDELSPDVYFHNETELELYTNQFYSLMPSVSSDYNWYLEQGEHMVAPVLSRELMGSRIMPTNASEVGWTWTQLRKINYYLQNSHNCSDEKARNKYDGIAYFFRAYFYYNMLTKFGELPWYDEPLSSSDSELLSKPRESREVIINHIIEDCDRAHELMAKASTDRTSLTINCWTPLALKSRACLFEGTFRRYHAGDVFNPQSLPWEDLLRSGAEAAKKLFTESGYSLYTEGPEPYRDLFATISPRECECIWARSCSEMMSIKNNANSMANRDTGFTKRFVNLYLNTDGTRFTDKPGYETMTYVEECRDRDPRMAQTVYCPGYIQKGETRTYPVNIETFTATGYRYIKYVMEVKYNGWDASLVSLPIFRLAEQYLNYAECLAELGTLTQSDLDISVNKLRDRVGMVHMSLADANAHPDSYMSSPETGYPNVTKSANTGVILEIRRERLIELALEGLHYNDILRWKEGKVYERPFYGQYFPGEGKYDLTGDGKANVALYIDKKPGGIGLKFLKIGVDITLSEGTKGYLVVHGNEALRRTWNEDRDYLYGIPINERLLTGCKLTQNPGWIDGIAN